MEYKTHNQDDLIDTNGTHLIDTIDLPYSEILQAFGTPLTGNFDKVQAEWTIQFDDGEVATIYDWKENRPYWGVTDWHIGGHNHIAAERVINILKGRKS